MLVALTWPSYRCWKWLRFLAWLLPLVHRSAVLLVCTSYVCSLPNLLPILIGAVSGLLNLPLLLKFLLGLALELGRELGLLRESLLKLGGKLRLLR